MNLKKYLLSVIIYFGACSLFAQNQPYLNPFLGHSETISFNENWKFYRYGLQPDGTYQPEVIGIEQPDFNDSDWNPVDLPHDFAINGPFRIELAGETGKLPYKGIGWYRKQFLIQKNNQNKRYYIDFDGVMAYAEVWINGHYLGIHPYGYSTFRVDLTPYLKFGEKNCVAVKVNTEKWDSRWYPGAGIYRNVWLIQTNQIHISQWGTFITTTEVSKEKAVLNLDIQIENHLNESKKIEVKTNIYEYINQKKGKLITSFPSNKIEINSQTKEKVTQNTTVFNPRLWDIQNPNLYLLETVISQNGNITETYYTTFGMRSINFSKEKGFLLNDKKIPLQGVCLHHDLGALGSAVNIFAIERQLNLLKEMGCNAIRTSHNPPTPELLYLADKMGFVVIDEAFDAWEKGKREWDYNKLFHDWHKIDLSSLVLRDRNHPSIIMWSIGNEVMEQRDYKLTKELANYVRSIDTTRPITNGYNDPDASREIGSVLPLDIMGVNYFFDQQSKWDNDPRYKKMPTIGSETSSCLSTRGVYFLDTLYKEWQISSYDYASPDWGCSPDHQFKILNQYPHILGEFVWTGFDYLGEPTPYNSSETNLLNFRSDPMKRAELEKKLKEIESKNPPSRSSYFGIIDLAGFPKDRFYLYQAQWRKELPMAHILPHWNWPDNIGSYIPVHVYSSGDEAELFLNGKSFGKKKRDPNTEFRFIWDSIPYQPGKLEVITFKNGSFWAKSEMITSDLPKKIMLVSDKNGFSQKNELIFITVSVCDQNGIFVPTAQNLISFHINGDAEIVATDNGDPTSFLPFKTETKPLFNGRLLLIIKAKKKGNLPITVEATSDGLEPAKLNFFIDSY